MNSKLKNYLIAVDLDDTLVTGFDNYDIKSFELLKSLSKDNYIVIATGRPLRSSIYYYNLLNLNTPLINYNGALVHNPKDNNFPKNSIIVPKEWVIKILEDNKDILINIFCEIEDDIFLYKEQKDIDPYLHLDGGTLHTGDFKETLYGNPNGAILFSKLGSEKTLEDYINKTFQGQLKIRFWDDKNYVVSEVYNPKTTKGNGIKQIIEYYNIDKEKTIAIGDGHNDIELFQEVNIKVAMENAHPDLKAIANYITKTTKENGVYHFLNDYINKKA